MRAFSIYRPVGLGTYPKGYEVADIVNFDVQQYVDEIGHTAFGYIDFTCDVPADELRRYDLMTTKPVDPRFASALACIVRLWKRGDEDRALEKFELAVTRYKLNREELYAAFENAIV